MTICKVKTPSFPRRLRLSARWGGAALCVLVSAFFLPLAALSGAEKKGGGEADDRYSFIPDPPAVVDAVAVPRAELVARLEKTFSGSGNAPLPERETLKREAAKALDELIHGILLRDFFRKQGMEASPEEVERYKKSWSALPGFDASALPDDGDIRLLLGASKYFEKTAPDKLKVSDDEAENFYRSNQLKFRRRAGCAYSLLAMDAATPGAESEMTRIRAEIAGGRALESFQSAAEVGSEDAGIAAAVAASQPAGTLSPVVRGKKLFMLIRTDRKTPDSFIPPDEVSPQIKRYLSGRKLAVLLAKLLSDLEKKSDIVRNEFAK